MCSRSTQSHPTILGLDISYIDFFKVVILYLLDGLNLSVESSCTAFNKRNVGCQTHSIDMSSSF